MRVVITGTHTGMGRAAAIEFLNNGHTVYGIDIKRSTIDHPNYTHRIADVADKFHLPVIHDVNILVNNAGVQNSGRDVEVNYQGIKNCTELYGLQPSIVSILNQASVSAHNGAEFPDYCASKGAVLAYTKWTATQIAKFGATCNSISCGGVITELNRPVIDDKSCWGEIMKVTPLKKWATSEEIAKWIYFLTVVNKSCTSQDIIIDNGEISDTHFVWK